jgi:hypothetical protein
MLRERLGMLARKYSLARKGGWLRLAETLGILFQAVVMGELLFYVVLMIHATNTGARVFRYMGY